MWLAIAILCVIASHTSFPYGGQGVSIFFGLSGLLICTRLIREEKRHGRISLAGFYARRVFRIFPAYYSYLTAVSAPAGRRTNPDFPRGVDELRFLLAQSFAVHAADDGMVGAGALLDPGAGGTFLPYPAGAADSDRPPRAGCSTKFAYRPGGVQLRPAGLLPIWSRLPDVFMVNRTDAHAGQPPVGAFVALLVHSDLRERLRKCLTVPVIVAMMAVTVACWVFSPKLHEAAAAILVPLVLAGSAFNAGAWVFRPLEWALVRCVGPTSRTACSSGSSFFSSCCRSPSRLAR